jgi:hypothetical protein
LRPTACSVATSPSPLGPPNTARTRWR